jgi:hypothetical protein
MRRRRKSLVELAACPPRELSRMAQDVGLSVSELMAIARANPGPRDLLPRRLQLLGVDPGYARSAHTMAYRDMERTCAMCRAWRLCACDLARGNAQAGMDTYCLNAEAIDALTVDQPARRRRPADRNGLQT